MRIRQLKPIALWAGISLIVAGYWLLAVPSDLSYQLVIDRAMAGIACVLAGGTLVIIGILRK